ncbi:MAG: hypothetical protein J6C78_00750 [Muribaculaceae bacterium]|nr:hypothetical protein [Muribaculaceae bacterium]
MKIDNHDINELIDRYFEGATSLDEERTLRRLLSDMSLSGDKIDEARAVMGYLSFPSGKVAAREIAMPRRNPLLGRLARAAVVTGLIAVVGTTFIVKPEYGEYMAYVGGKEVSDRNEVMAMVADELAMLGVAANEVNEEVAGQFSEVSDVFNELN